MNKYKLFFLISTLNFFIVLAIIRPFLRNNVQSTTKTTYFDIEKLEKKVQDDQKLYGPSLMVAGDINVTEFLQTLQEENKKWNVTLLSNKDIKGN